MKQETFLFQNIIQQLVLGFNMIINKPFKKIIKFTEYHNGKKTDLFKIWFLDNSTQVRTSDNKIVLSSKIMEKKI